MPVTREISLDDKYIAPQGTVFLTGMQALVRLLLLQRQRDQLAGHRTAGFVSGYRGSPIGGYDRELARANALLRDNDIHFQPGLNEDLAATACWGTQQLELFPGARYEGVFGVWYGKNPGLDRSTDAIKHASHYGTSRLGGVLAVVGDDHLAKSSAFGHQSEYGFIDNLMPILAPANVGEIMQLGLLGFALSRYCGSWVGFKLAGSICEGSAVVTLPDTRVEYPPAEFELPADGVHIRWPDDPAAIEHRAKYVKLPAAQAFVRAAGADRILGAGRGARLGVVAPGRAYAQLVEALGLLGIESEDLPRVGLRIYKPAMVWPLEPHTLMEFVEGLQTVLVAEDKRPLVEDQIKVLLHDHSREPGPRVLGKRDESGAPLFPETGEIDPLMLALALGRQLGVEPDRLDDIQRQLSAVRTSTGVARPPFFCAGCPHNTSTRVPEESIVIGGIGCHTLAMNMDRGMRTFAHMGGEGATWIGLAPFTDLPHVFQNMGDGTYQHSGSMGIRAAVAAGVRLTFKILYNDAVAMTGGQAVEGLPSVQRLTRQLTNECVRAIAVVTDDPGKYDIASDPFAAGVTVHHRSELDAVQKRLRDTQGVTALVYDQTCAAEKRRRRKRGALATPSRRVFINEMVCEGCGDCGVQSNCVAIVPVDSAHGMKRQIDQAACNQDFSCLNGFCPSFVTVENARLARRDWRDPRPLPPPPAAPALGAKCWSLLIAGIGGTGIVTVGAILGVAAHAEGLAASVNDVTGMAQKGGPVLSHVRLARGRGAIASERIPVGEADVLIAADLVVATMPDAQSRLSGSTVALVNTDTAQTGAFTSDPQALLDPERLLAVLESRVARVAAVPAVRAAVELTGDPVGCGLLMLGAAWQNGWVPLGSESIEKAIELNGVGVAANLAAFRWGRRLAADAGLGKSMGLATSHAHSLEELIDERAAFLADYQDKRYAERFRRLLDHVRGRETKVAPDSTELTRAVAQAAFKLMSYKDEYEVARLHSHPRFRARLAETFETGYRLKVHLAPPLLSRTDPATGVPRKIEFGGWILQVFPLLARLRFLRGSRLDPFGRTEERRLERHLIDEYFALIERLCVGLHPGNLPIAIEWAKLPLSYRGFGHVKLRAIQAGRAKHAALEQRWRAGAGEDSSAQPTR